VSLKESLFPVIAEIHVHIVHMSLESQGLYYVMLYFVCSFSVHCLKMILPLMSTVILSTANCSVGL